jgi:hypothetical protein
MFVTGVEVIGDLFTQRAGQRLDLLVHVAQSVVDVDAKLVEQRAVFGESVFIKDLDRVPEDDRVRDLHHRGLDVQ